ncbi:MAG: hypothetical protein FK734_10260 [Asgard group archaeon]|nr:hypothetical protein [Asgard group archaeon]
MFFLPCSNFSDIIYWKEGISTRLISPNFRIFFYIKPCSEFFDYSSKRDFDASIHFIEDDNSFKSPICSFCIRMPKGSPRKRNSEWNNYDWRFHG